MTTEQAKALKYERKNFYEVYPGKKDAAFEYAKGYREFIDAAKTEREAVDYAVDYAQKRGFVEFDPDKHYNAGDKIYYVNRKKAIYLAVIGQKQMSDGCRIIVAHTDSPRLDLKQHPLFESNDIAYLKTHYYGGIKKYQWLTLPLSLHGVVYRKDGSAVKISIGEDENEPVFYISDLMPHIGKDQMSKTMSEAVPGESLNLICGGDHYAGGKYSDIGAFFKHNGFAGLKNICIFVKYDRHRKSAESHIDGPVVFKSRHNGGTCLDCVGGIDDRHSGARAHKRHILTELMRCTVFTDGDACVACTYPYGQVCVSDRIAYLFIRSAARKHRKA